VEAIIQYWNQRIQSTAYGRRIQKVLRQNLKLISIYPELGRPTDYPFVKVKVILENFFLIYRIGSHDEIVVLNFWDCRQDPKLNKYL